MPYSKYLAGQMGAIELLTSGPFVAGSYAAPSPSTPDKPDAPAAKPIPVPGSASKLLGQRIMVGFSGTAPSGSLLGAVRRGEVGSVILFSGNIASRSGGRIASGPTAIGKDAKIAGQGAGGN